MGEFLYTGTFRIHDIVKTKPPMGEVTEQIFVTGTKESAERYNDDHNIHDPSIWGTYSLIE